MVETGQSSGEDGKPVQGIEELHSNQNEMTKYGSPVSPPNLC
jgi:hypothetical protein